MARKPLTWLSAAAAISVPTLIAVLAIVNPGLAVADLSLNDGSVWLTNTTDGKLGRFNARVGELNAGMVAQGDFDVAQDRQDVILAEPTSIGRVDPAAVALSAHAASAAGMRTSTASGVVAVNDPKTGQVWIRRASQLTSLKTDGPPDLDLGAGGRAVTSHNGQVLALAADGTVYRAGPNGSGKKTVGTLEGAGGAEEITAVGDQLVARIGTVIYTPAGTVDLTGFGTTLALQQPGPKSTEVLVAGSTDLIRVPLSGGQPKAQNTGGAGKPAAPVRLGSCAYGAWASVHNSYLRACDDATPQISDLEAMTTASRLVFRVNRDVIVLNDTMGGRVWDPLKDTHVIEPNWQTITPEERKSEHEETSTTISTNLSATCGQDSGSPQAVEDDLGVRPGRTVLLPVLDNDTSSDCGVLAITEVDPIPATFGTLSIAYGGRGLQLTTSPSATGQVSFTYTIDDGRSGSVPSTAQVRLSVRADNRAPEQTRVPTIEVEQGASVDVNVLASFIDPDGDDLALLSATAPSGTFRFRQDGQATYLAGSDSGRVQATVVVSDGTERTEGRVDFEVRPVGSLAPLIDPVLTVANPGVPVSIDALAAAHANSLEPIRLAGVEEDPGVRIVTDLDAGTFEFTAQHEGTYYVPFTVVAAPQQAQGLARVEVQAASEGKPPVAIRDLALVSGTEVTIDPLANDVDPTGGVLVLDSIEVPSGIKAAVIDHHLVRITPVNLRAATEITYRVAGKGGSATGVIVVQPVPSAASQTPVPQNIEAQVRTGGIVTIPIGPHVFNPDGVAVHLDKVDEPEQGLLFVSGDNLRYQAPDAPTTVYATYTVSDDAGNVASAQLTVTVHASSENKRPPRPQALTGRVFAGQTVRVPIELIGIDDDGDGVTLLGQDTAPTKGRIIKVGADWLEYQAYDDESGTDTFSYAVEDWTGQRAVAQVSIGIAPRSSAAALVTAHNDEVSVRPGVRIEARVLANDIDSAGGTLRLDEQLTMAPGVDARVQGRRIVVQTPDTAAVQQISYSVHNDRGGQDSAVLTVTVDPNAPIRPPIAADVVVPAADTINRKSVDVDVLALADNPSGSVADLQVSVHSSASAVGSVLADGRVRVQLTDHAQSIPYLLTNTAHDVGCYAFITVPALGDFPPTVRPKAPELKAISGEQVHIPLATYVQVAPGKTARITQASRVSATKSDGSPLVKDDTTLQYRSAKDYAGPASISFEVADDKGEDARTAILTLPIQVYGTEQVPPIFTPSVIEVAAGEGARTVDLRAFTSAPVETTTPNFEYRITGSVPNGFTAHLSGSVLAVSVESGTRTGTTGTLPISVGYSGGRSVDALVELKVRSSTRPLARVQDHQVSGDEGRPTTIDVLANAFNPFPDPLGVAGASLDDSSQATLTRSGSKVSITPKDGFRGVVRASYWVDDATGDANRQVTGHIQLTVRGKPDTPSGVRVTDVRDRTLVVGWNAPDSGGSPIVEYRVSAASGRGTVTTSCPSTSCPLSGLTNDVEYSITVQARNDVGWSNPSAPVTGRPDAVPAAVGAPTLSAGDRSISVSWPAGASSGSPVQSYDVEISPSAPGGAALSTAATSARFTGLTNGVSYSIRVRAHNRSVEPGAWSPAAAATPMGDPGAPQVTASRVDSPAGGEITVSWSRPDLNGAPAVQHYLLDISGGPGAGQQTLGGDLTSWVLTGAANGQEYVFSLRAVTAGGTSPPGIARATAWGSPDAPASPSASTSPSDTYKDGKAVLAWGGADGKGRPISYQVTLDGGRSWRAGTSPMTIGGLTGGQSYTFGVRACNDQNACSATVSAAPLTPITVPEAPTMAAPTGGVDSVTFTWSPKDTGGSPIANYRTQLVQHGTVEGEVVHTDLTSLRKVVAGASGTTIELRVKACNAAGCSVQSTTSAKVP